MGAEARAHYDRGLALFQAKDYAGATRELEAGYALEPRREFLFAEAQARRLAGDCRAAVPLYQRFLASGPPAVQVNATHIALGRCAQQLAAREEPRAAAPPAPATSLPTAPHPPAPPPPPWTHDRLGAALLGAGVAGLGVGAGFLAASYAARTATDTLPEYQHQRALAESRLTVSVVSLIGGGALAAASVARYAVVRRRQSQRLSISVISVVPGGLLVGGRF